MPVDPRTVSVANGGMNRIAPTASTSPRALVDAYRDAWNEPDADRRLDQLAQIWAACAEFVDPMARVEGPVEVSRHIDEVRERFPGLHLSWKGPLQRSRNWMQFRWELTSDGRSPLRGHDVVELGDDGRIERLASFWKSW
jgi:hypothetical protein